MHVSSGTAEEVLRCRNKRLGRIQQMLRRRTLKAKLSSSSRCNDLHLLLLCTLLLCLLELLMLNAQGQLSSPAKSRCNQMRILQLRHARLPVQRSINSRHNVACKIWKGFEEFRLHAPVANAMQRRLKNPAEAILSSRPIEMECVEYFVTPHEAKVARKKKPEAVRKCVVLVDNKTLSQSRPSQVINYWIVLDRLLTCSSRLSAQ